MYWWRGGIGYIHTEKKVAVATELIVENAGTPGSFSLRYRICDVLFLCPERGDQIVPDPPDV